MRISGIEILNAPNLISVILKLAKVCLKPKLFSRVCIKSFSYDILKLFL